MIYIISVQLQIAL